jgi:hypothetical protein
METLHGGMHVPGMKSYSDVVLYVPSRTQKHRTPMGGTTDYNTSQDLMWYVGYQKLHLPCTQHSIMWYKLNYEPDTEYYP